jgi:hypothetical protein
MKILPKARRLPNGTICHTHSVRLTSGEMAEVKYYAMNEEESLTWFLHEMVMRGLNDYKRELSTYQ